MIKSVFVCGILFLSALPSAYAQQATGARCDDESMKYIQSQVDMGADKLSASDRTMVAAEFEAARKARDSQQIDQCAVHLGNVVRTMNMDMSMMPKG